MTGNLLIVAMISSIVLAVVGIRIAGGTPWKGAVLALVFSVSTVLFSQFTQGLGLTMLAAAVVSAVLASAMRIPNKQAANALIGCLLGYLSPFLFA